MNIPHDAPVVTICYQVAEIPKIEAGQSWFGGHVRTSIDIVEIGEGWRDTPEMRYEVTERIRKIQAEES